MLPFLFFLYIFFKPRDLPLTHKHENLIQIVTGNHLVIIKEANFRMTIILQGANYLHQTKWVFDKIIEYLETAITPP